MKKPHGVGFATVLYVSIFHICIYVYMNDFKMNFKKSHDDQGYQLSRIIPGQLFTEMSCLRRPKERGSHPGGYINPLMGHILHSHGVL